MLEAVQTIIADLYDNYVTVRILRQQLADRGFPGASEHLQQLDPVHNRRIVVACKMYLAADVGRCYNFGAIY